MKWKIGWGLSNRCNMACKFCYSRKVRSEQVNFDNIFNCGVEFVKNNRDRIDSINFGTGEPTVEPMFFKFCKSLKSVAPNVLLGITTNGNLAKAVQTDENLAVFIECIDDVDVSLDYGSPIEQDQSRNTQNAFEGVIETLKICKKYHKNATVVSVLHKNNCSVENFEMMIRIARIYNASFRINILRPTVEFDYALPYQDLKNIFKKLIYTYQIESIADPLLAALIGAECKDGDPTARSSFRILPNACITPSTYLLDSTWQVLRLDELRNVDDLSETECFKRIKAVQIPQRCNNCQLKESCRGGVFDRRWLWYHDFNEIDPYCPTRFGEETDWKSDKISPIYSAEKKSFVHDGYLPTLIFNPTINERAFNKWDRIYTHSFEQYGSQTIDPYVAAHSVLTPLVNANILDLGCGIGRNGMEFLKDNHVTFVDNSQVAIDFLMEKIFEEKYYRNYTIALQSISDYLFSEKDELFDFVIAMHVLSHGTFEEIKTSFIIPIYNKLKKDGIVVLTLPSINDKRFLEGSPDEKKSFALNYGAEAGIIHSFFDRKDIEILLNDFSIIDIQEKITDATAHWMITAKK